VLPDASIIIPTFERPHELAGCLAALTQLDYAGSLEIVVVDDGGSTPLDEVVAGAAPDIEVRIVHTENGGPANARNKGAGVAAGEILAFTDDDCRPTPTWLAKLVARLADGADVAAGGHTVNALPDNLFASTSQLIIDVGYEHNNADRAHARFFTTNNLVVPAAAFREIGGFDVSFRTSEDREFCDRWVASGRRLEYVPEAVVFHRHDLDLRGFVRQQYAYGRGAYEFHRLVAARANRRIRVEPSFYRKLFLRPLDLDDRRRGAAMFALLQLWNLINTAGFVRQWWSRLSDRRPSPRR